MRLVIQTGRILSCEYEVRNANAILSYRIDLTASVVIDDRKFSEVTRSVRQIYCPKLRERSHDTAVDTRPSRGSLR